MDINKLPDRFRSKIVMDGDCWLWVPRSKGRRYGQYNADGTMVLAHRHSYQLLVGPIPEGLELDHVRARGCSSTFCVNPDHLEPVSHAENIRRGDGWGGVNTRKTHCKNGHPLEGSNLLVRGDGGRKCRKCQLAAQRRHYQRKTAAMKADTGFELKQLEID